jgi:hypothetical protein
VVEYQSVGEAEEDRKIVAMSKERGMLEEKLCMVTMMSSTLRPRQQASPPQEDCSVSAATFSSALT